GSSSAAARAATTACATSAGPWGRRTTCGCGWGWAALPAAATPPTTCSPPSARPSAGRWRCWSRTRPTPSSPSSSRGSPPPSSASTPERPDDHADRRSHPDHDPPAAAPAARPAGRRPRHRRPRARPLQHDRAPVAGDAGLGRGRRRRVRHPRGAHRRPAALPLPRGPMTTQIAAPTPTTTRPPLRPLLDQLAAGRDLTAVRELVEEGARTGEGGSIVAATGLFPFLVADLARRATAEAPLVIVTATTRAAEDLRAALSALVGTAHLVELPAWETLPHERLSPRADTVARRLSTLRR